MGDSYVTQALEILSQKNFDDRMNKLGKRNRDRAGAALESLTSTRDRMILRGSLRNMARKEFFL